MMMMRKTYLPLFLFLDNTFWCALPACPDTFSTDVVESGRRLEGSRTVGSTGPLVSSLELDSLTITPSP